VIAARLAGQIQERGSPRTDVPTEAAARPMRAGREPHNPLGGPLPSEGVQP
jgi:hypothetical protein